MIYGPKFVRPQTVRTPVSQIDVAPTLLGLLDFSYESRFYGSDALSPGYTPRIFTAAGKNRLPKPRRGGQSDAGQRLYRYPGQNP